jgi:hypothetical protein
LNEARYFEELFHGVKTSVDSPFNQQRWFYDVKPVSILSLSWRLGRRRRSNECLEVMRDLQGFTRYLHAICNSSKVI